MNDPDPPAIVRRIFAYAFGSAMTLEEMRDALGGASAWKWTQRSNDNWGDYLVSRVLPEPDYGVVKLIEHGGRFVANVSLESREADAAGRFEVVQGVLLDRVLPALGASGVEPVEDIE